MEFSSPNSKPSSLMSGRGFRSNRGLQLSRLCVAASHHDDTTSKEAVFTILRSRIGKTPVHCDYKEGKDVFPTHVAAECGNAETLALLLAAGFRVEALDPYDQSIEDIARHKQLVSGFAGAEKYYKVLQVLEKWSIPSFRAEMEAAYSAMMHAACPSSDSPPSVTAEFKADCGVIITGAHASRAAHDARPKNPRGGVPMDGFISPIRGHVSVLSTIPEGTNTHKPSLDDATITSSATSYTSNTASGSRDANPTVSPRLRVLQVGNDAQPRPAAPRRYDHTTDIDTTKPGARHKSSLVNMRMLSSTEPADYLGKMLEPVDRGCFKDGHRSMGSDSLQLLGPPAVQSKNCLRSQVCIIQ